MATISLQAHGGAPVSLAWERYADPALWSTWAPQIQRVETDSDGVYEAHIVTAAGDEVIVQVGKDFTVTGVLEGGPGGRPGPGGTGGTSSSGSATPSSA